MKGRTFLCGAVAAVLLTGCAQQGTGQDFGMVVGSVAGALLGSQIGSGVGNQAATALGAGLGAIIGAQLGADAERALDQSDERFIEDALIQALETPQPTTVAWRNPNSGNGGTVTAVGDVFFGADGEECRDFDLTFDDGRDTVIGAACQTSRGTWEVLQ